MSSLNRFDTAQWMFDRQRYAEAIAVLMDLLGENPGLAPIHALLALCQCALRQNALAVHHAEKAVELAPSDPENHFTVSQTLVRLFDWELGIVDNGQAGRRIIVKAVASPASMKALQAIQEAIRLRPDNPNYYAHLACLKLMFGRWGEAIEATNRGLETDPQSIACLVYRASAWLEKDDAVNSEESVKFLLAIDPNSPHGHAGLGDLCLYRRQPREAEQHYLEALRLNPMVLWAERGLDASRRAETRRAFVREIFANNDPMFGDPFRFIRQLRKIGCIFLWVVFCLVIIQIISSCLWPGNSLLHLVMGWLSTM